MADTKTQTPPWGDDFDAEKAWTLVTNLRDELKGVKDTNKELRTANADLTGKVEGFENAGKSEAEKAEANAKAQADALAAAQRELWTERALRKHGVPDELVEFLTGDDEEAILAKAEKLAGLGKSASADDKGGDKGGDTPPADKSSRPASGLTPGHGGDEPDTPFGTSDEDILSIR